MQRLRHLDGLRGVAALLVVYQHLVEYGGRMAAPDSWAALHLAQLWTWLDLGKVGVIAFFALSGFVVPYSFSGSLPALSFVVSRLLRLYPAYWVSLLAAVVLLPLLGQGGVGLPQFLANLSMAQRLLGHADVLGVYWTLLVELVFYASCLLVFGRGWLRSPGRCAGVACALLAAALAASVLRARGHAGMPVSLPLYLAIMWFAAGARLWLLENMPGARRCSLLVLALLLVAFPLAWSTAYDDASHRESVLAVITAFFVGLALFFWCVLGRRLDAPLLVRVGALSYSLYLFHPLALDIAHAAALHMPAPWRLPTLAAVTLVASFTAAWLVHHGVETRGIAAGRRCMSRIAAWHALRRAGHAHQASS